MKLSKVWTLGLGLAALAVPVQGAILINELDSDTPALPVNESAEFVELINTSGGVTPLDGMVLVFYNGNGDITYAAFDLDGFSTNAAGFFVAGNPGVANATLNFPINTLQNGADAVALFTGNATDFPNGTALTTANLLDAVVYDTNDADDTGLLPLLLAGGQVDESLLGLASDVQSIGRLPNGSGGPRDTTTFALTAPTPGGANVAAPPVPEPTGLGVLAIAAAYGLRRRRRPA